MIFIAIICLPKEHFVERTVIQVALLPRLTMSMTLPIPYGWGLGQSSFYMHEMTIPRGTDEG